MDTKELGRLWTILEDMHEQEVLEDRMEYDVGMLQKMYDLSKEGALHLHGLLWSYRGATGKLYNSHPTTQFGSVVTEAIHGGWDGWEDWQKVVIQRLINDIELAMSHEDGTEPIS